MRADSGLSPADHGISPPALAALGMPVHRTPREGVHSGRFVSAARVMPRLSNSRWIGRGVPWTRTKRTPADAAISWTGRHSAGPGPTQCQAPPTMMQ
jgi:hypothetical protein